MFKLPDLLAGAFLLIFFCLNLDDVRQSKVNRPKTAVESGDLDKEKRGRASGDKARYQQAACLDRSSAEANNSEPSVDRNMPEAPHATGAKYNRTLCAVNGFSEGSKVIMRDLNDCVGVIKWIGYNRKAVSQAVAPSYIAGVELLVS